MGRPRSTGRRAVAGLVLTAVFSFAVVGTAAYVVARVIARADALSEGRADDAYRMLSEDARRGITLEAFRQLVKTNKDEAVELGASLARPTDDPYVTAIVPLASAIVTVQGAGADSRAVKRTPSLGSPATAGS